MTATQERAQVFFAPVRTAGKKSLVARAGALLERAGLAQAVTEGDLVAVPAHPFRRRHPRDARPDDDGPHCSAPSRDLQRSPRSADPRARTQYRMERRLQIRRRRDWNQAGDPP